MNEPTDDTDTGLLPAERRPGRRSADLQVLAPHVDRAWAETFVVEQRLLGVPGDQIGDALVTVDSHVAESGESAGAAFGDPRDYAQQVSAAQGGGSMTIDSRTVLGSIFGLVAIALLPRALGDWLDGRAVSISVGDLVIVGLLAALCVVLFRASRSVLRFVVDHRWAGLLIAPVLVGVFVAALLVLPAEVTTLPVAVVAAAGLVAMLAEVVVLWRQPNDVLVNPTDPSGVTSATDRSPLLALTLGPGLVALMCLVTWALRLAS